MRQIELKGTRNNGEGVTNMTGQILWGSLVLGICSAVHLAFVIWWVRHLNAASARYDDLRPLLKITALIGGTFAVIVVAHTLQVWMWAVSFVWLSALPNLSEAIYFSLVTYTTLGYGDVTLSGDFKIFGAMASVTGLLNFGVSTAVLVGVIGRTLQTHLGSE